MSATEMSAAKKIKFCELLLRDGIQGWPEVLSTESKLALLHAIDKAGVAEIDLTSFVPAKFVPQFADAEQVLEGFQGNAEIRVLTVNIKGAERVVNAHQQIRPITTCGMPISASEQHNIANLRCDHATHKERLKAIVDLLLAADINPMVCVATAWGCPIAGEISADQVLEHVAWLRSVGVSNIMLGDTTGMADPARVETLFSALFAEWPDTDLIAHFHDNRGCGIANAIAAVNAGARSVDGCLGGLGGEPKSVDQGDVGDSGNVVSEDLLAVLGRIGYETGVDVSAMLAAGELAEKVIGRHLFSKLQRAGEISP
jgi:hydroxymethylglutaryl-CoA lyase